MQTFARATAARSGSAPPAAAAGAASPVLDKEAIRRRVEALFRAHARLVARWAARLGGPALEVEDVVQEVFLIAQQRLHTFNGTSQPTTWLYAITQNVVRHRRRRERVRRMFSLATERAARGLLEGRGPGVGELERREATRILYRLIDRLGEKYRDVFILFELEGMSGEDIAALTGINPTTVRVRLHRARALFLELFASRTLEERNAIAALAADPPAAAPAPTQRTGES
jgi:RNA polymerase sigma-70 factor (ECF subfamily)